MPRIIRQTLLERFLKLPETALFVDDFRETTGLALSLRDPLGVALGDQPLDSPLCRHLASTKAGRALCARVQQGLYTSASVAPNACHCDAGLHEAAAPLRFAERTIGFLVFRGIRTHGVEKRDLQRTHYLLAKSAVNIDPSMLADLLAQSRLMSAAAVDASNRVVALAAQQLMRQATSQHPQTERPLPRLTTLAQRYMRAHALTEACTLPAIARACAVSEAHLSRVFHESTGLTISEYLARTRVKHALEMLKQQPRSITEVAFASGFQSISQFNRTFRKVTDSTPSKTRRAGHGSPLGNPGDNA